jgi:hypothetical protein
MHLINTGRCPSYGHTSVKLCNSSPVDSCTGLHSASTAWYIQPRLRTVFGEYAFLFSDPKAWNAFMDHFHSIESTESQTRNNSKHLYLIILSSRYFVFIMMFSCQSAVGQNLCNWCFINYSLTYLLVLT